ncbi:major facilitator superfamily protein [Escherichia coli]|nr:major facilitator superfamily protein [Escherichia coli]
MIAAFLLARSIEWYWVYACIGLVYVAIFILTFGCEFPRWANMRQKRMLR